MLLLSWAEENLQSILAEHLAGADNVQADWLSRRRRLMKTEWQLNPQVFQEITVQFGVLKVDLFTSADNNQVPRGRQQGEEAIDALQSPKPQGLLYAFPPFPLIQRVLSRVREQKA